MPRSFRALLIVLFMACFLMPSVRIIAEGTWTERTSAGSQLWRDIASSADGTKLAAVASGSIWTSTDSGVTWTEQTSAGSQDWNAITSSADGTKLAATVSEGYIWTSNDSGVTWAERTIPGGSQIWYDITSSSDGTKLAAAVGSSLWTSTDSGVTWTEQTSAGSQLWRDIASSADGTKLAATVAFGSIWTSTDSGVTWTEQTASGSQSWYGITSSADGTKLAAMDGGLIWTSTDSGVTWGQQTSPGWLGLLASITSSSDGTKLAAAESGGLIWLSSDSGVTWTEQTSPGSQDWQSITSSSDGTVLAAVANSGSIWTYVENSTAAPTVNTSDTSSVTQSTATLNGSISDTGGETGSGTEHGFAYGTSSTLSTGVSTTTEGTYAGTGAFSSSVSSLSCNTTYYARAYATNSAGTGYGSIESFTTDPCAPAVTTSAASSESFASATLNGSVSDTGGAAVTERGFQYGSSAGYGSTVSTTGSFGAESFPSALSSLACNSTYHFRAFATNSAGTGYGADTTFATSACLGGGAPGSVGGGGGSVVVTPPRPQIIYPDGTRVYLDEQATTTPATVASTTAPSILSVTRDLFIDETGEDVRTLQRFLNARGFIVNPYPGKPGHPGFETAYFGYATRAALAAFQRANGISPSAGYFGPITRAFVQVMLR